MIMLVTAIASAAATPVAAQTADPTHSGHDTSSAKDCCCCDSQTANKAGDKMKKMACCEKASGNTPAGQHSEHNH